SDIYSLGVLLCELLTGERPKLRREDGRLREPLPPSRTEGGRGLPRDLDRIVLMAMQPEPEQRYSSASAMESDLRRFLASEPVRAQTGPLNYRASVLLSRNRSAVIVAGVLVAVAAAGWMIMQSRARSAGSLTPQITPVTSMPGSESQPYFSPDGKKIVYVWDG